MKTEGDKNSEKGFRILMAFISAPMILTIPFGKPLLLYGSVATLCLIGVVVFGALIGAALAATKY